MFKGVVNRISRGLAIALLISTMNVICQAATINDLRQYIGLQPIIVEDDSISNEIYYYNGYEESTVNSADGIIYDISDSDAEVLKIINETNKKELIQEYNDKLDELLSRLSSRLKENSTAYLITATVDEVIKVSKLVNEIENSTHKAVDIKNSDFNYDEYNKILGSDTTDEQYIAPDLIRESMSNLDISDISELDYNIGSIGNAASSVVSNFFYIVTPYGFTKHANEEKYTTNKLEGIELYAPEGTEIESQFNGIVALIGKDSAYNAEYIVIYHGNGLYTIYEHVHSIDNVRVGTRVNQGDVIAIATDTKKVSKDKENHIIYRIELNGKLINPLLIYGSKGKDLYEQWLTSHAIDNVVEQGESYYIEVDESYKPKQDDVREVIFPDFNIDD